MWKIENDSPFVAAGAMSQDYLSGGFVWQVVTKATFDISETGELAISDEPVEVFSSPVYRDEEDNSSILYNSDFEALTKSHVDILLNGHAYSPGGHLVKRLEIGLMVGDRFKQLNVFGNRYWDKSLGMIFETSPQSFVKMPIIYENAFGGTDDTGEEPVTFSPNPVGTGFAHKAKHRVGNRLPNIEYAEQPTKKGKPIKNKAAGYGPLCPHWESRARYAGTYDEKWQEERFPLYPFDLDPRFFQCAPEDQQVVWVGHGDCVKLLNLTPSTGFLEFRIPKVDFQISSKIGNNVLKHQLVLHSLIIEPDYPRFQMVWHSKIDCHAREHQLEYSLVLGQVDFF